MRTLTPIRALLLAWALLLHVPSALYAQNATSALSRAEIAYRGLNTLAAEFTQALVNPMLGAPERTAGVLFLAPPNRFAMRFTSTGERIVADGTSLWLYAPSSVPGQVIKQPIPRSGIASPNLMGQFVDRPHERYVVEYLREAEISGEVVDIVRLTPHDESLGFQWAEIAIARSDGILRQINILEVSGQRRTLVFRAIRTNVEIPPGELRFEVEEGLRVVEPGA